MSEEQNPGLIGEIVDGLHNLEQKVTNFIHQAPDAPPSDNSPSSTEPVREAGGTAQNPTDASGPLDAPAHGTQSDADANPALASGDAPAVAASGESSDASSADLSATADASQEPSITQETNASSAATAPQESQAPVEPSTSAAPLVGADDPNAAAPTAGDSSASDTQSSASPVSQVGEGLAIAAS
ncbi:hypothetical protein C3E98_030710, partial [Pseudomonas sp. MWU13-2625]